MTTGRSVVLTVLTALLGLSPLSAGEPLEDFGKALQSRDEEAMRAALRNVVRQGGRQNLKALLAQAGRIPPSEDGIYWSVVEAAASFVDREALEELGEAILAKKSAPMARDLVHALSANPSANVVAALGPVLLKGPQDLQLLAATKLGAVPVPGSVDVLIELLKKEESRSKDEPSALAWTVAESLTKITGQKYGTGPVNWEGWWGKNRERPLRAGGEAPARSTGTAVDFLGGVRQKEFVGVETAPQKGVVVLSARFTKPSERDLNNDHMEGVLESMRIPHVVVSREDFLGFDLSETGALLVNCAQFHKFCICPTCKPGGDRNNRLYRCTGCNVHKEFKPELSAEAIEKIKNFVLAGGYLFSEDWVVRELVEKAFPEYVSVGVKFRVGVEPPARGALPPAQKPEPPQVKLAKSEVDVAPVRGRATHPYLRDIFMPRHDAPARPRVRLDLDGDEKKAEGEVAGTDGGGGSDSAKTRVTETEYGKINAGEAELARVRHKWTIDDESYSLKVVNPAKVVALLGSGDLQNPARGDSVVALAFRPGSAVPVGQRGAPKGTPGVVVQVLSHFGKQTSVADEHSIQNLLLNFLIDANVAREKRSGAKQAE
jgi:hypothetical protein